MPGRTTSEAEPEARRAAWAVETFVELAGKLVADFDVVDVLSFLSERCLKLLDAAEVGLLIADSHDTLHVMASSSERMHALELFELQNAEGPCLDVYQGADAVLNESLASDGRWPHFAPAARAAGFETVHALPMRHGSQVVGVLNIFHDDSSVLVDPDERLAQALADIATFAVLETRALRHATVLADQLQAALHSRVVIEQAKGVLSERLGIDVAEAFGLLRHYSQNANERMDHVARRVIRRALSAEEIATAARRRLPRRGA